jgi:hypothetical protein
MQELIIQVSFSLIFILLTYIFYKYVYVPYKKFKYYQKIITENYKALVYPFSGLGNPSFRCYK